MKYKHNFLLVIFSLFFCLFMFLKYFFPLFVNNILYNYSLCWGQYKFLWTLKTIFTEAFRLRWILISKVLINSYWPIQKTVIVLLKWKVKVKPSLRDFCKSIACVGHDDYLLFFFFFFLPYWRSGLNHQV
jgi:hypothetical protein